MNRFIRKNKETIASCLTFIIGLIIIAGAFMIVDYKNKIIDNKSDYKTTADETVSDETFKIKSRNYYDNKNK